MPSGWKAKARVARSDEAAAERRERPLPARLLDWSGGALVAVAWAAAALFGAYIVFFYAGAIAAGTPEQWNANLPGLFVPGQGSEPPASPLTSRRAAPSSCRATSSWSAESAGPSPPSTAGPA